MGGDELPICPQCHSVNQLDCYQFPETNLVRDWLTDAAIFTQQPTGDTVQVGRCKVCSWVFATSPAIRAARRKRQQDQLKALFDLMKGNCT